MDAIQSPDSLHNVVVPSDQNEPEGTDSGKSGECRQSRRWHLHPSKTWVRSSGRLNSSDSTAIANRVASKLEIEDSRLSAKPILHRTDQCSSKEVFDCKKHKEIVSRLIAQQVPMFEVDDDSITNMAEALKFAGIDTFECAEIMNLQIIPPGPVFHTWYAYKGTTLFDGTNNRKKYDYVKQLNDQALRLAEWDIPMILVYTNNSMNEDQVERMDSLFEEHPNIIVLNIERDLSDLPISDRFSCQKKGEIRYLDGIRFEVLMDFQRILFKAKLQADNQGKKDISRRLDKWKNESITYMDMDNYFLRRPFFQIAPNGFIKTYYFSSHFNLDLIEARASSAGIVLPRDLVECARKHTNLLEFLELYGENTSIDYIQVKAEELYEFVKTGEAEKIWHKAREHISFEYMNMSWPKLLVPWDKDCNFYMVKKGFWEKIQGNLERIGPESQDDLNPVYGTDVEEEMMPPKDFEEKAIRLGGLQQIKCIYIGRHGSYM